MNKKAENDIIDLTTYVKLFLKHWYWFLICALVGGGAAFFYYSISPDEFSVGTSIIIDDEKSNSNASAQILSDIGFIQSNKKLGNELLVLKSSSLIRKAIQGLDVQVSYYEKERFTKKELYKSSPFLVIINREHPQPIECEFEVQVLNTNEFLIRANQEQVSIFNLSTAQYEKSVSPFLIEATGMFNRNIQSDNLNFKLILNTSIPIQELVGKTFSFKIHSANSLIKKIQSKLYVSPAAEDVTVVNISMNSSAPSKAKDILNSIAQSYIDSELEKKLYISDKTILYINNQLRSIQSSLQVAEDNLQNFRSRNELIDINLQSDHIFTELSNMESEKAVMEINMKYYEYIDDYFQKEDSIELIAPSAMGIDDPMLNNLIEELIKLNAERNSLVENNQGKSPYLRKIDIRINNLKSMVAENIAYYKQTNRIAINDLNARIGQLNNEVRKLPKTQRELLGFERQFNINDAIYSYLLEKKAEAEIAKASYQSNAEILEPADIIWQIGPNRNKILVIGLVGALSIPGLILVLISILRRTYIDEEEVKKALDIPYIGHIYKKTHKGNDIVRNFPESHMAESFRKLRNNLNYFLPEEGARVIAISSTISEEGKTFVSLNLAMSLASSGNKTILLGFDLRKPNLYTGLNLEDNVGISEYLIQQVGINDIIQKTNMPNLHAIWAGFTPPNPAELIASLATEELISSLKNEFDYIIIDTPPIGILSDGLILFNHADLKLFVSRLKRAPKKESRDIVEELKENGVSNIALVVNDVPINKKGRYGYGYYGQKK